MDKNVEKIGEIFGKNFYLQKFIIIFSKANFMK